MKRKKWMAVCFIIVMVLAVWKPAAAAAAGGQEAGYQGDGYEVRVQVTGEWDSGFNAEVVIRNTGETGMDNWAFAFSMPHDITNLWNGVLSSTGEGHYIVKNTGSNQDIAAGESVSFGFTASKDEDIILPEVFTPVMKREVVPAEDYEAAFHVVSDWGTAFQGELRITNRSTEVIEDWEASFDADFNITAFYTANILARENGRYLVKNRGYNSGILPGQTITLGFEASPGNAGTELRDMELSQVVTGEYQTDAGTDKETDTDGDGLPDYMEEMLGTSCTSKDTDGDGLTDFVEVYFGLDPLVSDAGEDFDGDGLTTSEELEYGTHFFLDDTDGDGLTDYEEIKRYHTSPTEADTDGDGLEDGAEIRLGLDPLSADSDGDGIPDGKEKLPQTLAVRFEGVEKNAILSVEVSMEATGEVEKTTRIENTCGKDILSSGVVGLVGVPVEITTSSEFDEATITFTYDESVLGEVKEENLRVMWYDEENNRYVILDGESILDTENNTVSYKTTHFSTYLVVDRQAWYDVWSRAVSYERKPDSPAKPEYFDICYVIDKSGSMSGDRMATAKEAIRHFIEAMYSGDRGAIVGFDDDAKVYQMFTPDKTRLFGALDMVTAEGLTSVDRGLKTALDLFPSAGEQLESGILNSRMILLLCDGDASYMPDTLNRAKAMGVKIYPVLISSHYGKAVLQRLADETGGKFYYAATAEEIREAVFGIQEAALGEIDTTDTDGDGLYDIYETAGMLLPNGRYVYTDPENPDTDGDGLTDGEEMGVLKSFEEQSIMKQMELELKGFDSKVYAEYFDYRSDPTKRDTDGDGYEDGVDPRRFRKDVRVVAIRDAERFVEIWDGDIRYYGGYQGWYKEKLARDGACGTVAAANITAYMAGRDEKYKQLYGYDDFSKGNFLAHMNEMYEFLKPFRIPFTEIPLGIWPMGRFEKAVEKFAKEKGTAFNGVRDFSHFTRENVINYIENGLKKDAPVAMLIGFNNRLNDIEVMQPNGHSWIQSSFETHWVVITELKTDDITGKSIAKVSTWGGYSYLDLDAYLKGEKVYQCLLYFE